MDLTKFYEAMDANKLKFWLSNSMRDLGLTTLDSLKDDKIIEKVAQKTYKLIPLIPFRTVIKGTLGKKGFEKLVFKIRDRMITAESLDLSWLTMTEIKSLLSNTNKN